MILLNEVFETILIKHIFEGDELEKEICAHGCMITEGMGLLEG